MFENASQNISKVFNGINWNQPIPITLTQTQNPYQFWITAGIGLITSGLIIVPILMSESNPIKKNKALKEFNKLTGRPSIVVDHTKQTLFKTQMINDKTLSNITKNIIKLGNCPFNLVLNSGGGSVFHSQAISDLLKTYKGKIHVYVPKYAMSGASLLALSGTEIHMTDTSSLGPIDPQIGSFLGSGSAEGWNKVVELKGNKASDNSILHSLTGKQVTSTIRNDIYELIKDKCSRAKEFTDYVTSGKVEHIKRIKKSDLLNYGFNNIYDITDQEQKILCNLVD